MKLKTRPNIAYSDGQYYLRSYGGFEGYEPYAELWFWRRWWFGLLGWCDRRAQRWIQRQDRAAAARRSR